jgi:hypothetical protein
MRFRYAQEVDCTALGRRVSIRYRTPDGKASDVVGVLEQCDEQRFAVRNRRAQLVTVARSDVVASRIVAG